MLPRRNCSRAPGFVSTRLRFAPMKSPLRHNATHAIRSFPPQNSDLSKVRTRAYYRSLRRKLRSDAKGAGFVKKASSVAKGSFVVLRPNRRKVGSVGSGQERLPLEEKRHSFPNTRYKGSAIPSFCASSVGSSDGNCDQLDTVPNVRLEIHLDVSTSTSSNEDSRELDDTGGMADVVQNQILYEEVDALGSPDRSPSRKRTVSMLGSALEATGTDDPNTLSSRGSKRWQSSSDEATCLTSFEARIRETGSDEEDGWTLLRWQQHHRRLLSPKKSKRMQQKKQPSRSAGPGSSDICSSTFTDQITREDLCIVTKTEVNALDDRESCDDGCKRVEHDRESDVNKSLTSSPENNACLWALKSCNKSPLNGNSVLGYAMEKTASDHFQKDVGNTLKTIDSTKICLHASHEADEHSGSLVAFGNRTMEHEEQSGDSGVVCKANMGMMSWEDSRLDYEDPSEAGSARRIDEGLFCSTQLEIEDDQEPQLKPTKILCKRKTISPSSQERLLRASKSGENEECGSCFLISKNQIHWDSHAPTKSPVPNQQVPQCHSTTRIAFRLPSENRATETNAEKASGSLFPVAPQDSQSPALHVRLRRAVVEVSPPVEASPVSLPKKGILRSPSQSCQGLCSCAKCASVRTRAERATEFSRRQMQDIEGVAVKLMNDLSFLREIIEDELIQGDAKAAEGSSTSRKSQEKAKTAASRALATEQIARKWLIRMTRDCNRYCKIMQGRQKRRLSFADERGGKLCHVKMLDSDEAMDGSIAEMTALP